MAILIQSWENDGDNGHAEIAYIRSDAKDYNLEAFIEKYKAIEECTLITKSRTDRQSHLKHILFERENSNRY